MFNKVKKFFKAFFFAITFVFRVTFALLNFIVLSISTFIGFIFRKIRFSITFKLNFIYGLLYVTLSTITLWLGAAIFSYYLKHPTLSSFTREQTFLLIVIVLLSISLSLFLSFGKILVTKMFEPLKNMTTTVQKISGHEIKARLDTTGAKDELKDLAITFNAMMDRLETFVQHQQQFVSDASHELRTPIAVIQGYADLLARWGTEDPAILTESIQSIKDEAASMKDLVEKLLFLARSDKKTLQVDKVTLNLSQLAHQTLKEIGFIDDEHEFISRIEPDIMITGDAHLIKELLRILLDNAIKYTPEGGVITISCVQTFQSTTLSVKDTGIGIPNEHLHSLFERFYRADTARTKNAGGTGLGLAIAKEICKAHNAQIFVNSTVGEGSEFIIFF